MRANGSDIEVQEVDSDEEAEEDVHESDNEDVADVIDNEIAWSNTLTNFSISQFNSQPGIKVGTKEEPGSDFSFNLIFGDEMVDLIVRETNRYARQKLATNIA